MSARRKNRTRGVSLHQTEAIAVSPLDPADLLDLPELSQRLRVKPSCVHEWLRKRGTSDCIPFFKLGRHLRFSWSEVSEWVRAQRNKKGAGGRRRQKNQKHAKLIRGGAAA